MSTFTLRADAHRFLTAIERVLLVTGALFVLSCAKEAPAPAPPSAEVLAFLERAVGTVTLERAGAKSPAATGYLYARDALETGVDSSATIRLSQGRTVELGSDARFVLSRDKSGLVLEVERGLVMSRLPADGAVVDEKLGTLQVSILTPFGLTRVGAEPNDLSIDVQKDRARVDVLLGSVEFVDKDGKSVRAGAGQRLEISAGRIEVLARVPEEPLAPRAVKVSAEGRAELRRQGQNRWTLVSGRGAELAKGDGVRVRSGRASASPVGTPNRFVLAEGGEAVLQGAEGRKGFEHASLELKKGKGLWSSQGKNRVDVGPFQLESDLGGAFTVVKVGETFEVQVLTGDWTVRRDGQTQAVRAGNGARLGKDGLVAVEGGRGPPLVLPSRKGLLVYHSGPSEVMVSWAGDSHEYDVQVATDAEFQNLVLAGRVHETQARVPAPSRGILYWRILDAQTKAEVDEGNARFGPEPSVRDLARLRNEVPEGTERTTIYFQDKPPTVTFTFGVEPKAAQYRLKVFQAKALGTPVAERKASTNRIALEEGTLGEGKYLWSVTPLGKAGEEIRGGRMNKLEIVYDNSVPSLVIQQPRNGERSASSIRASGIAPVNAHLIINGRQAALDEQHRFNLMASPVGNPPTLVFRLMRPASPDVFTLRTLSGRR
jgi:hypothetical protein